MSRLQQALDALREERAALQDELAWLDEQIAVFEARVARADATASAPQPASRPSAGSRRRTPSPKGANAGTVRGIRGRARAGGNADAAPAAASSAPALRDDVRDRIITFLTEHAQSTAADVAKGIDEHRTTVATRLVELARAGEIVKASRGYSAE